LNPASLIIQVALADDHQMVREGLKRVLGATGDITVVAEARDGHELLERLKEQPVDVALLDLSMPGLAGMDLIRRVKADYPQVAVLVLTMHAEEQYAMRAFRSGATGYITKDCAAEELIQAIRKVAGGGGYVTPALAERLAIGLSALHDAPPHTLLSDRELEVLRLIVAGKRLTDIADELHLSVKTVSTHKSRILDKMRLDGTAALVRYALQHRLFDDALAPLAASPGAPDVG
jgi:DNA-binding NarL/FixJ family response regulator